MNLDPTSRAILKKIDLHFHDLRREAARAGLMLACRSQRSSAGSGITNVSQTSAYLAGTSTTEHDHMRRFEEHQAALQKFANPGGQRDRSAASIGLALDQKAQQNRGPPRSGCVVAKFHTAGVSGSNPLAPTT
jgi:hypothetical protein